MKLLGGGDNWESSEGFDVDKKRVITESSTKKKLSGKKLLMSKLENIFEIILLKEQYQDLSCSWKEGNFGFIPCRHEIARCAIKLKGVNLLYFAKRWQINSITYFR